MFPCDDPWNLCVGCLQERICAIEGVSIAILLHRLALELLARQPTTRIGVAAGLVLVDVVTEEHERVEIILFDQVAVGRVVAPFPVLTRREREAKAFGLRAHRSEGPGPSAAEETNEEMSQGLNTDKTPKRTTNHELLESHE